MWKSWESQEATPIIKRKSFFWNCDSSSSLKNNFYRLSRGENGKQKSGQITSLTNTGGLTQQLKISCLNFSEAKLKSGINWWLLTFWDIF